VLVTINLNVMDRSTAALKVEDNLVKSEESLKGDFILNHIDGRNIFDTHCHIDFILQRKLRNSNIKDFSHLSASYPGITHPKLEGFINNFCDPYSWPQQSPPSLLNTKDFPELKIFYTVGCHPHYAQFMESSDAEEQLRTLLEMGKGRGLLAVGECGLDVSNNSRVALGTQISAFKRQILLSLSLSLPLVLHLRGTEELGSEVLESCSVPRRHPIHLHCWTSDWERCREWLNKWENSVIGVTALITFSEAKIVHEVVYKIPLDRLVLETDAPYFTPEYTSNIFPESIRYPWSHPLCVLAVAVQVAKIKNLRVDFVLRQCRRNAARIYGIKTEEDV